MRPVPAHSRYAKEKAEKAAENAKRQKSIEIAINLLKEGQTVSFTAKITQLAPDFAEQLAIDNGIAYTV